MSSGIYRINGPNNTIYFGSAVDIDKRIYRHQWELNKGIHASTHMQRHYNKYGKNAFKFSVVELVDNADDLLDVEQDYLDWLFRYVDSNERYNTSRVAGNWIGNKHSDAAKAKMSVARKGKALRTGSILTQETKNKIAFAHADEYDFISPLGEIVHIVNLRKFCRDHLLDYRAMQDVYKQRNRRKSYKGWKKNVIHV